MPIVGVGNLTTGGEGKTPLVVELARLANSVGLAPAISLSAYGSPSSAGTTVLLPSDHVSAPLHGDEPAEVRTALPSTPIVLGRDRVAAAFAAEKAGWQSLLLDDGFQHLPLGRTADLVIWDDELGNKRLLPAGPFREPLSGLARADVIATYNRPPKVWSGPSFRLRREFLHFRNLASETKMPLEWVSGKEIEVACAIARPDAFLETLKKLGAKVRTSTALGDHESFSGYSFGNLPTVVTEKDATKIQDAPDNVYSLAMRTRFEDEEAVAQWLLKTLSR
jgi:tetraacyldisaccharide 4'-kinase